MDTNKSYLKVIIVQNNPVYKDINQNIKYLTETLKDFSEKEKLIFYYLQKWL